MIFQVLYIFTDLALLSFGYWINILRFSYSDYCYEATSKISWNMYTMKTAYEFDFFCTKINL